VYYPSQDPKLAARGRTFLAPPLRSGPRPSHLRTSTSKRLFVPDADEEALVLYNHEFLNYWHRLKLISDLKSSGIIRPVYRVKAVNPETGQMERFWKHPFTGKPVKSITAEIPGYSMIPVDSYLRFFKARFSLMDELRKAAQKAGRGGLTAGEIDAAILKAEVRVADDLENVLNPKDFMAFLSQKRSVPMIRSSEPMYIAPTVAAKRLNQWYTPVGPFFTLFVDAPLDAWRIAVLSLSTRWVINNIMGNILLTVLGGYNPFPAFTNQAYTSGFLDALPKKLRSKVVQETSFFQEQKLGRVAGRLERITEKETNPIYRDLARRYLKISGTAPTAKTLELSDFVRKVNLDVEQAFRGNVAMQATKRQLLTEFGRGFFKTHEQFLDKVSTLMKDPKRQDALIKEVNRVLFDYLHMSPTERKYVRGITPFWSWYKNITLFTARLPAINPVGLEVMLKLGEVARTVRDHELRDAGINPDLLPQWAGGSVLLSDQGETLTLLNTRGRNPFADIPFLGAGNVSETIQPYLKSFLESDLGMQMFGERPFSFDDSILTFGGRQIVFNPITGMPQEAPKARISTFLGQAIRSFPQVRLAEELVQGGEPRFFSPVPFTGEKIPQTEESPYFRTRLQTIAAYLGSGTTNIRKRQFRERQQENVQRESSALFNRGLKLRLAKQNAARLKK